MQLPFPNPRQVVFPIGPKMASRRAEMIADGIQITPPPHSLAIVAPFETSGDWILPPTGRELLYDGGISVQLDRPLDYPANAQPRQVLIHPRLGGFRIVEPYWMLALSPHWYSLNNIDAGRTYSSIMPAFCIHVAPHEVVIWNLDKLQNT